MENPSPSYDALIFELRERVKELNCIYAINEMTTDYSVPFEKVIQDISNRIPLGFKYPEHTCARITIEGRVTKTANFRHCKERLEAEIKVHDATVGTLEVGYFDPLPPDGSPFLEGERDLVQAIATHIGKTIAGRNLVDALEESEKRFRRLVDNAIVGVFQTSPAGKLLYTNDTCLRLFGCKSVEDAMATNTVQWYRNPGDREKLIALLKEKGSVSG